MKKLLIATRNKYKRQQFLFLLKKFPLHLKTLRDYLPEKIAEKGKTTEENALIKARFWFKKTGLITLADDAGLEIDALNGEPGLQVRRWNGKFNDDIDDEIWLSYLLKKLENVPLEKRTARYKATWAVVLPNKKELIKNIFLEFLILEKPVRPYAPGSPLSAVRFFPEYKKVETQMSKKEKWSKLKKEMEDWKEFKNLIK